MTTEAVDHEPLWRVPVTYGAIGGTQSEDLLSFPPAGFRPNEARARIGHGDARWEFASVQIMTWGLKRRAGFRVDPVPVPAEVLDNSYVPVVFDASGVPVTSATMRGEPAYSPEGDELLRPGDTAVLSVGVGNARVYEPVRVVYVVNEAARQGFAYGTLPGHPLRGEESFVVERRDDDSVWITVRSFSRPANRWWWALYPALRFVQAVVTRRYLRALAVPLD